MKVLSFANLAKTIVIAGALLTANMIPLTAKAAAGGTACIVNVPPGGSCTVTTSCFVGVCHCVVVCCCS